jgi:hypothetical protein
MLGFAKKPSDPEVESPWLVEMRQRQSAAREYAARIEQVLADAGYDPNMLNDLPPAYIAAALALGVK